jgi:Holliday junction DNA helicase RuvB
LQSKKVPMALKTLSAVSGESIDTLENVIEPHLMTIGFIEKTSKGRVLTSAGSAHIA